MKIDRSDIIRVAIDFAKGVIGAAELKQAFEGYCEATGVNYDKYMGKPYSWRRLEAQRIVIDCIYALSSDQLGTLDMAFESFVDEARPP